MRRAGAARFSELGGYRQQPDRHRLTLGARVPPLYPLTRAREGGADLSAVGQQRDPLAPPAGRVADSTLVIFRFGANDGARAFGAIDHAAGGRAQRGSAS